MDPQMMVSSDGSMKVLIHLVVPVNEQRTEWMIACLPDKAKLYNEPGQLPRQRSDDPHAVTCLNCKHTSHYKRLVGYTEARK